ncbi:unnamed protein product [Pseudo-nitzschia multistriata]|uniref:Uncharacterized protein n=1 Tax=Pseudo-nitzschia multistriata TaxID=183589 RepID=A0A448ZGW2_9STRA|nr:unnamed protein product [Pseudo-nitzschia multistriata]
MTPERQTMAHNPIFRKKYDGKRQKLIEYFFSKALFRDPRSRLSSGRWMRRFWNHARSVNCCTKIHWDIYRN